MAHSETGRDHPAPHHDTTGAAAVFTARQRLGLFAACVLLTMLRLPHAWAGGRFMDEEGTIFLAYAWHRPAAEALWHAFGGYLNLGANAGTLLAARLVRSGALPLERAPYVTMTLALTAQMLPAVLVLTGRAVWLANRAAVIASLLLLAVAPKTEEVFFNTLHIQFHLALAAALILALDIPRHRAARIAFCAVLVLAPLCGPGAIVLWPFFVLRSLLDRQPARIAQTVAFTAAIAVQLAVFFTPSPVRGDVLDPWTLLVIVALRTLAMPVAMLKPGAIGRWVHGAWLAGDAGWWLLVGAAAAVVGGLGLLARRDRWAAAMWLIFPGLAIAAVSFGGGMIRAGSREWFSIGAAERYNFLPLILLGFGCIALARRHRGVARLPYAGLVGSILLTGIVSYVSPIREFASGPSWQREVAVWHGDHDHPLASWPAEWTVDLSDRDRPCSDAGRTDPSYCESSWLARVDVPAALRPR